MAELIKAFNKMEARYNDMEKMMNRKFVDLESVFQSKIDRFENQVLRKLTGVVNTAVSTLKEELGEEIDDLSKRVKKLEEREEHGQERMIVDGASDQMSGSINTTNMNMIVRNLPERENENTMAEVKCLIKDGLKIRDITVESAIRKSNNSGESKPGIVIAKFKSKDEKSTVMKSKNKLKDSRRYSKVFLEHDLPRHQRMLNANIRTIVKTLGRQELEFDGTRVKVKDSYSNRGEREQSDFSSENSRNSRYRNNTRGEGRHRRERSRSEGRRDTRYSERRREDHNDRRTDEWNRQGYGYNYRERENNEHERSNYNRGRNAGYEYRSYQEGRNYGNRARQ